MAAEAATCGKHPQNRFSGNQILRPRFLVAAKQNLLILAAGGRLSSLSLRSLRDAAMTLRKGALAHPQKQKRTASLRSFLFQAAFELGCFSA
jgi:hypothetical protein